MSLLGIDVGTTGCKAGAYGLDGRSLGAAYREYDLIHSQAGWAELDSEIVFRAVKEVISEAAAGTAGDPITALSVSAMGEAATPVSRDRRILGRCIIASADTRGAEYVERIEAELGDADWYSINPNIFNAGYTLPKLLWLKDNEPRLYEEADLFLCWPDLVQFLLGAEPAMNYSHANRTLLFDIERCEWSSRVLTIAGLDSGKLPPVAPSGTVVGTVAPATARELGLSDGVAIVTGAHDQCCNALGAGVIDPGRAVCGIGTIECITPTYGSLPDLEHLRTIGLNAEHHVVAGRYVSFIYNQAGSLVKWFRNTFATGAGSEYDELFAEVPEEPTNMLVLPYFEMTGAPTFVSDASGAILGLRTSTTRGEILKAILESETFYFAACMSLLPDLGIDTSVLTATGGGAKSDVWLQIKADVLGMPVVRLENTEAGTLGAAINAGVATGVFASPAEGTERYVRTGSRFEPREKHASYYRDRLALYRRLYPAIREFL